MWDLAAQFGGWAMTTVVVVTLFVKIEHRMTRVETLVTVIAGKVGICQQNSEEDTP